MSAGELLVIARDVAEVEEILDRACIERLTPDGKRIRTLSERVKDLSDQLTNILTRVQNLG